MEKKHIYKNIAVSVEAKELLEELSTKIGINRGKFVEALIKKAYEEMFEQIKRNTKEG